MPSMLDSFLPQPHLRERERVAVVADPPKAWDTIRHLDAYRLGFTRALFALRQLPDVLADRLATTTTEPGPHHTLDDFTQKGADFQMLKEEPGHGFVVGAVGRFWQPHLEFQHLAPGDSFAGFDVPGFGKIVWGLSVEKRRSGGSWVTFELRVGTTDPASEAAFDRYWALIAPFSLAIRKAVLGLVEKELDPIDVSRVALPGDLIIPAKYSKTDGTVIEARVEDVWPWLVQLGCQRAGWYAIDAFDNGGRPSADTLHPEWQSLAEGDLIAAVPDGSSHLGVLMLEPNRALVLGSPSLRKKGPPTKEREAPFKLTWAFVLEPIGDEACWLATRVRADFEPGFDFGVKYGWEALAHLVMQRAQLAHLKTRAEQMTLRA
jgi:hypothetical protein